MEISQNSSEFLEHIEACYPKDVYEAMKNGVATLQNPCAKDLLDLLTRVLDQSPEIAQQRQVARRSWTTRMNS